MSNSESEQYDLLDRLADEFAARFRRGERPALKEYTDRYPELADDILELFPAMVKVERAEGLRQGVEEIEESRCHELSPEGDRRLPDPPRDRPGRHGGRVRGRTDLAGPPGGAQGFAAAGVRRPNDPWSGSAARPAPRHDCTTPTSCLSSR